MPREIVIIGAGPGGLASAILLGAAGFKVTLLEKMHTVGGRTSSIEEKGFRFDLGPTFFLYPKILDEIMQVAGTSLRREVEMVRLDPQYRVQFGAGGQIDATADPVRMEEQIAKLCPKDAGGFRKFMADNRNKFNSIRNCLERPFLGWSSLLAKEVLASITHIRPWESVDDYLHKFFSDERVRLAFSFQSKYLGMSPFRCPSLFSILSYLEYDYGVWHPVGGCGEVSRAMARVAERMGVDVRLNESVDSLEFVGKKVVAVRTKVGRYALDALVINADFAHAMRTLVPDALRNHWTNKKLDEKNYSCSTFMLYLGVKGGFPEMPHHTIQISPEYRKNLQEIEDLKVLPSVPSFYVQNACVTDRSLAPEGHSTIYLLAPVPHRTANIDWVKEKSKFRDQLLDSAEAAGFSGLKSRICFEKIVTPDDWEQSYSIHLGATFNLAHSLKQMLHFRPGNRFGDLEGVYLAGGGTHPGSGLPVIYEGARITAKLICEDFRVPFSMESVAPSWVENQEQCSGPIAAKVAVQAASHC